MTTLMATNWEKRDLWDLEVETQKEWRKRRFSKKWVLRVRWWEHNRCCVVRNCLANVPNQSVSLCIANAFRAIWCAAKNVPAINVATTLTLRINAKRPERQYYKRIRMLSRTNWKWLVASSLSWRSKRAVIARKPVVPKNTVNVTSRESSVPISATAKIVSMVVQTHSNHHDCEAVDPCIEFGPCRTQVRARLITSSA